MKICKIADKLKKSTGRNYIMRAGKYGTIFAEFHAVDREDFSALCAKALRIKWAEVEYHTYNMIVRVWTVEDWNIVKSNNAEAEKLVNGFWETLHNLGRKAADAYYKAHEADYIQLGI